MAEIEAGFSVFPNGVPWLYAVFVMLFAFFLFVMPFLLEIDQHIKKFLLRCRCSLRNASNKDKGNNELKIDHLGRPRCLLQAPGREAPRREAAGVREDSSVLVEMVGERTQEVCPVTSV
ncbi:uncharacterized protein LOC102919334 [Peromyscus maniculatus bairdii]|uniref:Uncharacterized LOC102919334 n=1 Tax=Peromyscus maniculatus bairdii TaxID=230844 RepID=A0A6I9M9P5_PERMB|nr:uncharacterized protein LOC102919334 [Peromyscus maniculatus bairdii]